MSLSINCASLSIALSQKLNHASDRDLQLQACAQLLRFYTGKLNQHWASARWIYHQLVLLLNELSSDISLQLISAIIGFQAIPWIQFELNFKRFLSSELLHYVYHSKNDSFSMLIAVDSAEKLSQKYWINIFVQLIVTLENNKFPVQRWHELSICIVVVVTINKWNELLSLLSLLPKDFGLMGQLTLPLRPPYFEFNRQLLIGFN